jgi:polyhydroxybutyrate depolymerase
MDGLAPLPVQPISELRTITVDDNQRQFHLVPGARPAGNAPRPLLIVYHGAGDAAVNIKNNTGIAQYAEKAGIVVAYPDAVEGYNARWATNPVDLEIVDDLEFSRAIVDEIDNDYPIDRARIFALGYSRGGDLVYQIACRDPQFIRAGVAIASTRLTSNNEWCAATAQNTVQPAMTTILGSVDPLMPWDGGGSALRMGAIESATFFAERNGCRSGAPTESAHPAYSGYRIRRFTFEPCTKSDVVLFRVEPLGHDWPSRAFDIEPQLIQWMLAQPAR